MFNSDLQLISELALVYEPPEWHPDLLNRPEMALHRPGGFDDNKIEQSRRQSFFVT